MSTKFKTFEHEQTSNHFQTVCARSGVEHDQAYGAIMPPIYLSSNFSFAGFEQPRQYDYSRSGNPTRDILGQTLAQLEGGATGVITSTGMSAVLLALQLLKPGETLVYPHDCYGGSYRLFTSLADRGQFNGVAINFHAEDWLQQIITAKPSLIWVETPSNPLLRITDIKAVSEAAKSIGAVLVVDNTFLSPGWQQPISLGADVVIHSTTKYINGHSDVVGGAVIAKDEEIGEQLAWWCNCLGISGAPFDAFLTLRGLKTLPGRLQQHQQNTQSIVEHLQQSKFIKRIYYPGLDSHPQHQLAKQQQQGFGAIVSFEVNLNGESLKRFIEGFKVFSLAESLGGVESLICHPATMTHAAMDEEARFKAGISNQLIRLSVGLEYSQELIADLEYAFKQATTGEDIEYSFNNKTQIERASLQLL